MAYPGAGSSHVDGPGSCEGNGRLTEARVGVVYLVTGSVSGSGIPKLVGTGVGDFEVWIEGGGLVVLRLDVGGILNAKVSANHLGTL